MCSMSVQHTPGPWKTRDGFDGDSIEIYRPNPKIKKPFYPTQLATVPAEDKEGKVNARLIAAAPDLLEALKLAYPHINPKAVDASRVRTAPVSECYVNTIVRAAISKATGEQV